MDKRDLVVGDNKVNHLTIDLTFLHTFYPVLGGIQELVRKSIEGSLHCQLRVKDPLHRDVDPRWGHRLGTEDGIDQYHAHASNMLRLGLGTVRVR